MHEYPNQESYRTTEPTAPDPHIPYLLQTSKTLDWPDIEVQTYLEPARLECWAEPVAPDITLLVLTQGATRLTQRNCDSCKGILLRSGDLMLKPADSVIPDLRWESLDEAKLHTLRLRLSYALFYRLIEEVLDRDPASIKLIPLAGFQDPMLAQLGFNLLRELEFPTSLSPLYAQTAAQMLAIHLLRHYSIQTIAMRDPANSLTPQQFRRVTEYIQAYLTNPLSLDELAQQTGFSPYHFARLFRQMVGESPHQFVLRQRVEYAKRLLRNPDLTITQIAIESGFAHQSHLTQMFKRFVGTTPKSFRNQF